MSLLRAVANVIVIVTAIAIAITITLLSLWSTFSVPVSIVSLLRALAGKACHNSCGCLGEWERGEWI